MARGVPLSDAIEEFVTSRSSQGKRVSTIRNNRQTLRDLLTAVGNIQTRNVTSRHIDMYFTSASQRRSPAVLNNDLATLGLFFRWCRLRKYMERDDDPTAGHNPRKVAPRDRNRVAPAQFAALLNAAGKDHARDRMVVALGLYLFLRQGEIASLRLRDVDLENGEIRVEIHKTSDLDYMPISSELDAELRRWLTWYAEHHGSLDPDWYLVPAKHAPTWVHNQQGRFQAAPGVLLLKPERMMTKIEEVAKRALVGIDFPIRDAQGVSTREGIHTLRRSGARALFDELASRGYDGALQRVRAMLHHSTGTMTERYLGINVERRQRDAQVKGQPLFPSLAEAEARVVPFERVASVSRAETGV